MAEKFISPSSSTANLPLQENHQRLTGYYQLHAKIYDATRWSFLFGRSAMISSLASRIHATQILEVGCGTGKNLLALATAFPDAEITGVDLSADMLAVARRTLVEHRQRIQLIQAPYQAAPDKKPRYDLILFAYSLTMFNPGWEAAIADAYTDLYLDGTIAVVDFHTTTFPPFAQWMGVNHVRMDGHLLPCLKERFSPLACEVAPAYGGLWHYLLFLGQK